jgi:predicted dehydrogenase
VNLQNTLASTPSASGASSVASLSRPATDGSARANGKTPAASARIGVIGCGARLRRVLELLLPLAPELSITAVYDPDAQNVSALKTQFAPGAAECPTSRAVCERSDVDWVFIGSWNRFHATQVIEAFGAGKHVFCEKPLALSLDEARAMRVAQKAGGIFALGLVLRYSPLYRRAKELLDQGAIGRLVSFEFNETLDFNHGGYIHGNWRRLRANAGTHLLEKCCHDLDVALWLIGSRPGAVASFGGCGFFRPANAHHVHRIGPSPTDGRAAYRAWPNPGGVDPFGGDDGGDIVDNQVAALEFDNGVHGTFHTNCNAGMPERRFYLLGEEGALRLDAMTGCVELSRIGWNEPLLTYAVTQGGCHAGGDELMAAELVGVLRGECSPAAGFAEGVRSLALANAIDAAMEGHRVVNMRAQWLSLEEEFGPLFAPSEHAK